MNRPFDLSGKNAEENLQNALKAYQLRSPFTSKKGAMLQYTEGVWEIQISSVLLYDLRVATVGEYANPFCSITFSTPEGSWLNSVFERFDENNVSVLSPQLLTAANKGRRTPVTMDDAYSMRSLKKGKDGGCTFKADVPHNASTNELTLYILDATSKPAKPLTNLTVIPKNSAITVVLSVHSWQQQQNIGAKWIVSQIKINSMGGDNVPRFVGDEEVNLNEICETEFTNNVSSSSSASSAQYGNEGFTQWAKNNE